MSKKAVKRIKIVLVFTFVFFSIYAYSYFNSVQLQKQKETEIISTILKDLEKGDKDSLAKAMRSASEIGEPVIEPLIDSIKESDRGFMKNAAETLIKIGNVAKKPLIKALDDKERSVRLTAIYALVKSDPDWIKSDDALSRIPELIENLGSEDKYIPLDSIEVLRRIGEPSIEPLIKALDDSNWRKREFAAAALGRISDSRSVDALIELLKDDQWHVRRTAAYALGKLNSLKAMGPLNELSEKDSVSDVRMAAEDGMKRLKMLAEKTDG